MTARHRNSRRAALVYVCVLVAALLTACSSATDRPGAPAEPTLSPSPRTSASPERTPDPTPDPPAQSSSRTPAPSVRESTWTATPRQLVGLVRIVASIGTDGRGETATGMVLTGDGTVVTNHHAVAGATAVEATVMSTGRTYPARVVAGSATRDVALLRLEGAPRLDTVTWARRDAVEGDPVTVVGDAHGSTSSFTASTGQVLARDQTLVTPTTSTARGERLTGLTLSSCNVVLGESGGPTYDAKGRVVGMTTASVRLGRRLSGVAIPVGTLRRVVDRLSTG